MKTLQQIVTPEVKGQKLAAWQNVLCYILSASKDSAATHARSLLEKRVQYIDTHILQPLGNDFSKLEESLVKVSFLDSVASDLSCSFLPTVGLVLFLFRFYLSCLTTVLSADYSTLFLLS